MNTNAHQLYLPIEIQILQLLDSDDPMSYSQIAGVLHQAGRPIFDPASLHKTLCKLEGDMAVRRIHQILECGIWKITEVGKDRLRIYFLKPMEIIDHPDEVDLSDSATLCINEDELDGWWGECDVEIKAGIFATYVLGSDKSLTRGFELTEEAVRARIGVAARQAKQSDAAVQR